MILRTALVALLAVLAGCGTTTTTPGAAETTAVASTATNQVPATPSKKATQSQDAKSRGASGLPVVELRSLPIEARQTYELIWDGGPFPYRQDDQVFGNREGLLPTAGYGWYREYTVRTPGSPDRGARRFVVSDDNVFYYTDDHYDSFREVIE